MKIMGKEKGKFTQKILHLGHLLLEFLRNVVKAIGKPDKTHKQTHHGTDISKGIAKNTGKSGSKAAKGAAKSGAAKSGSSLGTSSLSGLGSGTSALTSTTGLAGTIISIKTLGVVLVATSLFISGLGIYSHVTNQEPLTVVESILNIGGNQGNTQNNQNPSLNNPETNPPSETNIAEQSQDSSSQENQANQANQISQANGNNPSSNYQFSPGTNSHSSIPGEYYPGVHGNNQNGEDNDQDSENGTNQPIDYEIP